MDANYADTMRDANEANRDHLGDSILNDAKKNLYPTKTLFNMALHKELSRRLTMAHIKENIVNAMETAGGNFFLLRLEQLPDAILSDDELLSAILMRSVWQAIKKPLVAKIKKEFEDNPWKIEEVLNAS